MLHNYINDVCEILNIKAPKISYDTSKFQSDTTLAQCDTDCKAIYIKRLRNNNPDQLFAIAHELRHIWQMKTDEHFYFNDYNPVHLCNSVEEYNLQIAEIDANAFATIIMVDFFHLKPQFEGLPDDVKIKIYERIEIIKTT